MWQKCPICNGEGRITNNGYSSSLFSTCPTCNGTRIISELTGLPPAYLAGNSTTTIENFEENQSKTFISHNYLEDTTGKCSICGGSKYQHPIITNTLG